MSRAEHCIAASESGSGVVSKLLAVNCKFGNWHQNLHNIWNSEHRGGKNCVFSSSSSELKSGESVRHCFGFLIGWEWWVIFLLKELALRLCLGAALLLFPFCHKGLGRNSFAYRRAQKPLPVCPKMAISVLHWIQRSRPRVDPRGESFIKLPRWWNLLAKKDLVSYVKWFRRWFPLNGE